MPQETPLSSWHQDHGGKMVDFAGWSLPVAYGGGIIAEHLATRKFGGLFDISHMGRFRVGGPKALDFLEYALTNSARKLGPGRSQYTLISDERGFPVDDAYLYQLDEADYLLVVNAANKQKDWEWLNQANAAGADLHDISAEMAMLAVQGPKAEQLVTSLTGDDLPPNGRNNSAWCTFDGARVLVSRTGYTGEPICFELFAAWDQAAGLWQRLVDSGETLGVIPVGLGARDTLRLEACLPLYGHEFAPDRPIMSVSTARLGVDLRPKHGDFIGKGALTEQRAATPQKVVAVAALAKGMIREGSPVMLDGKQVGELTSGTTVPAWTFEQGAPGDESYVRPIGLALVDYAVQPGQEIEIIYRKRTLPGVVAAALAKPSGNYIQPILFQERN